MKSVICILTFVVSAIAPGAYGDVPHGPDAISGAFVRMMAGRDGGPTRPIVRGEPDPVAVTVARALQAQRIDEQMVAQRPSRPGTDPAPSR